MVSELRDVHLDALAGGDIQEVATAAAVAGGGSELLVLAEEHDPPTRVEAAIL